MEKVNDSEQKHNLIRTCPKCKQTKPLALFRYQLTRAQAKQQGFAGNTSSWQRARCAKSAAPSANP